MNVKAKVNEKVKVKLTDSEKTLIKTGLTGSGVIYDALHYADIHYNTLFKSALVEGKAIKKGQRDRLLEFVKSIKKAKAA